MALRDFLRRNKPKQPAARAFEPPTYFAGVNRMPLAAAGDPTNARLLAAVSGWHAIAARAIADRLQSLEPIVVVRRRVAKGTYNEEELDDHILKRLLDNPNGVMTRIQLMRVTAQWLTTCGEAYWLKVTNRNHVPIELWPLSPAHMEIVTDPDTQIRGYIFRGERKEIEYERDEVVRFWMPHPQNPFLAVGNLGPQSTAYDAAKFLDETMRDHFENDATPKVALVAGEKAHSPTPAEKTAFETDWRARYDARRGSARRLPAIIPSGFTPFEFQSFGGMIENVALLDHYRDQILMANGVPRSILGDVVDANRAAAETNQYVFDQHTILPITTLIADTLTVRLAGDFDPKLVVRFRDFVATDKTYELASEAQDLATKVRTVNHVREDRGLDPVEWGDEPIGSIADVPYNAEEARGAQLQPDAPDALDDGDEAEGADDAAEDAPPRVHGRSGGRGAFSPRREWARVLRRERLYTPRLKNALLSVFGEQQRDALAKLDAARARIGVDDVFRLLDWTRIFRMRVEPIRREAYLGTAKETLLSLNAKAGDFVLNERVVKTLERQATDAMRINATTHKKLARALAEGAANGESIDGIAKRVRSVFRTRRAHAETIARTEILRATQAAQVESFEQSGVVERKQWNTSMDDAVRDSHMLDGEVVDLNDSFVLADGEQADAPGIGAGGGALSAGNAINCRCFLTPVMG